MIGDEITLNSMNNVNKKVELKNTS